jgi:hypothetical protein
MAGAKIENLPTPTSEAAPTPKDLAALKPAHEHQLIRLRNVEGFTVHLGSGDLKVGAEARCDRMPGLDDPQSFLLPSFTPLQVTGGAHQALKDFRLVPRMQHEESHTLENMLLYTIHSGIIHLLVKNMSPPEQYVRLTEHVFTQTVFSFIESRGAGTKALFLEMTGECVVYPVWIDLLDSFVDLFVAILVPNRDAY